MKDQLIKFENIDWEKPHIGVEQKIFSDGKNRLRLLKFNDDFVEEHWCLKGHVGFVVNGEMTVDFDGDMKHFKKGDGLWIESGELSKHKVSIESGKYVELILFEAED